MQITIYRTVDGYSLHPHLGCERLEMALAEDVQVREEPLRGTVRVYRHEAGLTVDRALALGLLEPVTYSDDEEAEADHPYRDLLYSMMNLWAA